MPQIPENVYDDIKKMIPASVINEISCFVFYDGHPRDQKLIDITICTKNGQVREYFKRDLMSSLDLNCVSKVSEIRILRNSSAQLFYLVLFDDVLCILSRKDELKIHKKVSNIEKYDISDSMCNGQAFLKVVRKDDAVPLVFDDNFENLCDRELLFSSLHADNSLPLLTHLMRKLTEAKFSVKCNEKRYRELLTLRQLAAFSIYQKIHPNVDDSVFKRGLKEITGVLNVKVQTPWVKLCNGKLVLVLNVTNQNNDPIEDVHILLQSSAKSMVYKTRLFVTTSISPYWRENYNHDIKPNMETSVLAVIDLKEIQNSIRSPIEFNGVLSYRKNGKDYLLPFDNVVLSSLDIMGEEFDVLAGSNIDNKSILAIMGTSEKIDLIFRHIRRDTEENLILGEVLCSYLQLEKVSSTDNIVIHRKSPYHTLHGLMIVIKEEVDQIIFPISLFTRSPSQVLALMHYIHDAVPFKILITTPNQMITAKTQQYSNYNEEMNSDEQLHFDYKSYASTILKRAGMVIEFLDNSMIKMHESNNPAIKSMIGKEIDIFARGVEDYKKFRDKMLEDTWQAINSLLNKVTDTVEDDVMIIDIDSIE